MEPSVALCWIRKIAALSITMLNLSIFFVTAGAAPSTKDFVSIDCGGVGGLDPVTGLKWTSDAAYLQAAEQLAGERVTVNVNVTLNVSNEALVDNAERLKTALIFRPGISTRSKFCYNLPMNSNNSNDNLKPLFLLRATFPSSNLKVDSDDKDGIAAYSTRFYFSVDSTYVATVELDKDRPQTIELIIFPLGTSNHTYVCLVPLEDRSSMPAMSALELRPLQEWMYYVYSYAYKNTISSSYLMTIFRQNFGGDPEKASLRYPDDPCDRLWSSPPLTIPNVTPVTNTTYVNFTNVYLFDSLRPPEAIVATAWEGSNLNSTISLTWNLSQSTRRFSSFYWTLVFCDILKSEKRKEQKRIVNLAYNFYNESGSPKYPGDQPYWSDEEIRDVYGPYDLLNSMWEFLVEDANFNLKVASNGSSNLPPLINAAEIMGELRAVPERTAQNDVEAVVDLVNNSQSALDSMGDPCLPIPWTWIICSMELPPRVTQINVTRKSIGGSLSDTFSGLDRLNVLDLSFNELESGMEVLGKISTLAELNLESNKLRGELPVLTAQSLGNLKTLSLSNNSLKGNVSSLLQAMDITISNLNLSHNFFSGMIPKEINNLTNLQNLDMSSNDLSGDFILDLKKLTKLQHLILNNNSLSGSVPDGIWSSKSGNLEIVNLDGNNFTHLNLTSWYKSIRDDNASSWSWKVQSRHNKINHIYPEDMKIDDEQHQHTRLLTYSILLAGNPWCNKRKGLSSEERIVRYLCRLTDQDEFWPTPDHHGISANTLISIIVPCGLLAIFITCMLAYVLWKIRRRAIELQQIREALAKEHVKPRFFDYDELKVATHSFCKDNILGKGGFGTVYKAVLGDGSILAVKRLNPTEQNTSDFLKEMVNISGIKHKHLIQLKGCCVRDKQQRILVYEYAENKSLAEALWGVDKPLILSWEKRFKICLGIARGLAYLHEELQPRMIHRDIKPQNILLDKDYKAKIADFGLIRPSQTDFTSVTFTISGTRGYSPPEYISEGLVSEKLDVYSLGIVFLEIISGRLCIDHQLPMEKIYLRNWTIQLNEEGKLLDLVDPELMGEYKEEEVLLVLETAMTCCQLDSKKRPTMSQVVNSLMQRADVALDIVKELRARRPEFLEDIQEECEDIPVSDMDSQFSEELALVPSSGDPKSDTYIESVELSDMKPRCGCGKSTKTRSNE